MAESTLENMGILELRQTSIVVKDLEETIQQYRQLLGVENWETHDVDGSRMPVMTCHGRQVKHRFRIAHAMVGYIQLELIQPLEGENIFSAFLEKHGEGLHHLGHIKVNDIDEAIRDFESRGFECIQSGRSDNGGYAHIDMVKSLGAVIELVQRPQNTSGNSIKTELHPPIVGNFDLRQICVVVRDMKEAMLNYQQILGIAVGESHNIDENRVSNMTYYGKPVKHVFSVAHAMVGETQLELIQPVEGENIYNDFLLEQGQGIHHLGHIKVTNVDKAIHEFESRGFKCIQSGGFDGGRYAYIDTINALGTIIELVRRPGEQSA